MEEFMQRVASLAWAAAEWKLGGLAQDFKEMLALNKELIAENQHLRRHWEAEDPADLVWNEIDGLHNENDLGYQLELEGRIEEMMDALLTYVPEKVLRRLGITGGDDA